MSHEINHEIGVKASPATRRSPRPIPCNNPAIVIGATKLLSWPLSMIFMYWE